MSADGIIILLIITLLVGVPLAALWGKAQGQKHPLPPPHHHDFEKWEDCKLIQRATWDGIAIGQPIERNGQTRACKSCGLRENRI